jgi:hypothetical protein
MKSLEKKKLEDEIARLKEINANQLRLNKKEIGLREQAQHEAQGVKVMLSILVQMQGGKVEISDEMLRAVTFDLRIAYDPSRLSTLIFSNPAENVLKR